MRLFRTIGLSSFLIFSSFSLFSQDYVQLGSGTSSSSSNTITPWTTFFEDGRKQLLFTASELSAAGLNVGDEIDAMAFDIVSANALATNLNIGLKSTAQTTFPAFAFESGFTTYFSGTHTPSAGWDQISFSSNYVWDGNGIIVEFCYNNSSFTGNSTINYSTTSHTSNRYAYTDGNDGCVLSSFGSNSNRANVRFYLDKPSLLSIERNNPASASTTSTNMQFQLSFSTDVALLDTADISLNGSAAANTSIQSVSRVNGAQYLVDVLTSNPSTGMIGLDIKGVDGSGSNNIIADNSVLDQQALNDIQVTNSPEFGQSFVAGASGPLLKVVLRTGFGHSYSGSGVMEIRSGSGLGGTVLASENVTIPSGPLFTDIFFYFSNPATLSSGSTYTLRFNFPGASSSNLAVSAQTGNPYANGILYQPAALSSADLYFKTYIAPSIVPLTNNLPTIDESYEFVVCNLGSNVTLNQGANCEGQNGSATVSGTNGQTPYTYNWANGENTATASTLEYGTTAVTISDALGCTTSASASIGSDCSIHLKGNGQLIFNNQIAVSTSDSTDFGATGVGSTTSVNYTIVNRSAGVLTIDSVRIGGVDPTDFSLTQPPAGSINAGDSTSFTVEFAPTGYGTKDATIQIYNTSADAALYAFNIRGVASHNGLNFDGTNDFAEVTDDNALDFTTAFTLEAWVNPDVLTTSGLITKFGNGSSNRSFALLLLSNGTLEFSFSSNGSSENYVGSAGSIQAGVWSHVAAVYDGSIMKIYINGVQDPNTQSISGNVFNSTKPLLLGARDNGSIGLQFNGTLDEVRLWSVAKTATDIANNKNCQLYGTENNLAAYYDFNQGTPGGNNSAIQHVLDRTANGLNAQINNLSLTNSSSSNFIVGASDSVDVCTQAITLSTRIDNQISCNVASNGAATVSVMGGTPPYTYLWSASAGSSTDSSASGLAAGTHTVTVTDNLGVSAITGITLTEPSAIVISTSIDSIPTCYGSSDGGATASATGGTMPYSYLWDNNSSSASITGLQAGTYTLTITDVNGCTSTATQVISNPDTTVYSADIINNACPGSSNGSIQVNVVSGNSPATLNWSNGEKDSVITFSSQSFEGNAQDNWAYTDSTTNYDCSSRHSYFGVVPVEKDAQGNVVAIDARAPYDIYAVQTNDVIATYGYNTVNAASYHNPTYFSPYASTMQNRFVIGFFNVGNEQYLVGAFDLHNEAGFNVGGNASLNIEQASAYSGYNPTLFIDDSVAVNISGSIDRADTVTYNSTTGIAQYNFEWLKESTDGFIYGPVYDSVRIQINSNTVNTERIGLLGHKDTPNGTYRVHKTRTDAEPNYEINLYPLKSGQCMLMANAIESSSVSGSDPQIGNASDGSQFYKNVNTTAFDTVAERTLTFAPVQLSGNGNRLNFDYYAANLSFHEDTVTLLIAYDSSNNWTQVPLEQTLPRSTSGWQQISVPLADSAQTVRMQIRSVTNETDDIVAFDNFRIEQLSIGIDQLTSGSYSFTAIDRNGCMSSASFTVQDTLSSSTSSVSVSSCDSYTWAQNGMTYTAAGMYNDTIPNAAGCDSVITLSLTINPSTSSGLTISTCDNYTWSQNGMTYTTTGLYKDTIPNTAGCDSVITLNLTINNTVRDTNQVVACDNYLWASNNQTYTMSGVYSDTLTATNGCDSISSIDLTINLSTSTTLSMTSCDSYLWSQNGMTYTTSGMYRDTIPNAAGCDSVITLDLTINNTVRDTNVVVACDNYTWTSNGLTYTTSGIYSDTLMAANGCDSISSIGLTINSSTSSGLIISTCDNYTWSQNGMTYSTSGMYKDTIPNAAGCDSVITLDLTINNTVRDTNAVVACDSYVWSSNGLTYNTSGIYSDTLMAANGCDSISSIDLTINLSTSTTLSMTSCDSYLWSQNGMTYTTTGLYKDTIPNAAGCDSVITLDLTINNTVRDTNAVVACDSYTWMSNNQTYTMSGIYSDTLMAANGCDSIASIDLTINPSTSSMQVVTSCDNYTWMQNGMTYTATGMYNDTIPNAGGCDSVITLDLTINNTIRDTNVVTACDSYTWSSNGMMYTTSGVYSDTLMAVNGCDSISSIDLTLSISTSSMQVVTSCDNYTWMQNGMTYTATGMYNDTIPNAAGCDSVITLDLTIRNTWRDTINVTAANNFIWGVNNITYTSSGIYSDSTLAMNGCDSISVLDLTIQTIDTSTSRNGLILFSNQSGATYQWVDCNNGFMPITGETGQSFTAIANGSYAVIVTINGVSDTSACISVINVGLDNPGRKIEQLSIYPNPSREMITLDYSGTIIKGEQVLIYNISGAIAYETRLEENKQQINLSHLDNGVYFIRFRDKTQRLIISR